MTYFRWNVDGCCWEDSCCVFAFNWNVQSTLLCAFSTLQISVLFLAYHSQNTSRENTNNLRIFFIFLNHLTLTLDDKFPFCNPYLDFILKSIWLPLMQFRGWTLRSSCQYFPTLWGSSNSGQNLLNYKGTKHAKDKSETLPGEDWLGLWINHPSKQKILFCLSITTLWLIIFSLLQLKGELPGRKLKDWLLNSLKSSTFWFSRKKKRYLELNVTQNLHAQTSSNWKCPGLCGEQWSGSGGRLIPCWPALQAVLDKFIMRPTTGVYLLRARLR